MSESTIIMKGAPVAAAITENALARSEALRESGIEPMLAIVRVGARYDDLAYERSAMARCKKAGVSVTQAFLPDDCGDAELLSALRALDANDLVHGILLLRPLPDGMDDAAARNAISLKKDVDGVTDAAFAAVFAGAGAKHGNTPAGSAWFAPCTAQACVETLDYYGIGISGKRVSIIGRSPVVGRPLSMLMLGRNATVTICHTKTEGLPAVCREADILIACAGRLGLVGAGFVSPGQTVVDVGIHMGDDGRMRGDVDFDAVADSAGAITPVPGGVGSVTSSILARNVVAAAEAVRERACEMARAVAAGRAPRPGAAYDERR